MNSKLLTVPLLAVLLGVSGCSREQAGEAEVRTAPAASAGSESPLLAWVPENTPYVAAIREPLPEATVLEFIGRMDPMAELERSMTDLRRTAADQPEMEPVLAFLVALLEEIGDVRQPESYARLGLRPNATQVVYGLGLLPVARIELADAGRFEAFLGRMIERADLEIEQRELRGVAYRVFEIESLQLISAIVEGHWVLTLAPAAADESVLAQVLGLERPARSLYGSPRLREIEQRHGFLPHGTAHLSTELLFSELLNPSHPASAALAELWGGAPEGPAECGDDLKRIAARLPGVVAGVTAFDGRSSSTRMVLLTDAAIAADLAQLKASVPGMDRATGIGSLALGLNLGPLPTVVQRYAGELRSQPLACEALADLNGVWDEFGRTLANPAMFMVAPAFSGLRVQLDALSLDGEGQPTGEGHLLIGSPTAPSLVALASGFVPQLAALDLKPGEAPKPLPEDLLPVPGLVAYAAMTESAIAVGVGEKSRAALPAALAAPVPERPYLLHSRASGEFYTAMAKLLDGLALPVDEGNDVAGQLRHYGKVYRQLVFWMAASEHGLDVAVELEIN